ncbi:hypothetical protein [Roseospira navarrensis]|uniref:Uncharacterized protein n=1 Tax=Roseospira navarrensis TaxID=140058 RepID=A0A7X2D4V7_9PROT|nr:hypothetical protein [Roseospira navarrensis]MQX38333.1 hypothetical protein [Roseospira navarrensis]
MSNTPAASVPSAGWAGIAAVLFGGLALLIVLIEFSAGPFAPQPEASTVIGETAAGIRDAARRALAGEAPPPPTARTWDIDRVIALAGMATGGVAVILAVLGAVLREPRTALVGGAALGATAILLKVSIWIALLVAGVVILWAIIDNIGDILPG